MIFHIKNKDWKFCAYWLYCKNVKSHICTEFFLFFLHEKNHFEFACPVHWARLVGRRWSRLLCVSFFVPVFFHMNLLNEIYFYQKDLKIIYNCAYQEEYFSLYLYIVNFSFSVGHPFENPQTLDTFSPYVSSKWLPVETATGISSNFFLPFFFNCIQIEMFN